MGSIARRLSKETDFSVATELALSALASEESQKTMLKMVSFLGFKNSILFFVAFGGTKVKVPTLKDFTKTIMVAKAALEVVKGGKTVFSAAQKFRCKKNDVQKLCTLLKKHLEVRRQFYKSYTEGDLRMFANTSDALNQVEEVE